MKKILLLLSVVFTTTLFAQTGSIRGFVYEKGSGEPIMFCNVVLKGTTIGSPTDINGMYNIPKEQNNIVTYGNNIKATSMLLVHRVPSSMDQAVTFLNSITNGNFNIKKS